MLFPRFFALFVASLACFGGAEPPAGRSVHLAISLNQTTALHARSVVLTSPDGRDHRAVLKGDVFLIPKGLLEYPKLDVTIFLKGESLHLAAISQDELKGKWEVSLSDRGFAPRFALPEGAKPNEVCVVAFEVGKGDPVEMAQSNCRQRSK